MWCLALSEKLSIIKFVLGSQSQKGPEKPGVPPHLCTVFNRRLALEPMSDWYFHKLTFGKEGFFSQLFDHPRSELWWSTTGSWSRRPPKNDPTSFRCKHRHCGETMVWLVLQIKLPNNKKIKSKQWLQTRDLFSFLPICFCWFLFTANILKHIFPSLLECKWLHFSWHLGKTAEPPIGNMSLSARKAGKWPNSASLLSSLHYLEGRTAFQYLLDTVRLG